MAVGLWDEINVTRRHSRRVSVVVMFQMLVAPTPTAPQDAFATSGSSFY